MNKRSKPRSWELPEIVMNALLQVIPTKKNGIDRLIEINIRRILAGIFYVRRTGIQWQACSRKEFGPPSTVCYHFSKWYREGIFASMAIRDWNSTTACGESTGNGKASTAP